MAVGLGLNFLAQGLKNLGKKSIEQFGKQTVQDYLSDDFLNTYGASGLTAQSLYDAYQARQKYRQLKNMPLDPSDVMTGGLTSRLLNSAVDYIKNEPVFGSDYVPHDLTSEEFMKGSIMRNYNPKR